MQSLLILGRQPALGRAELESLYGAGQVEPAGDNAMLCSLPAAKIDFARLGGSVKLCTILETVASTNWRELQPLVIAHGRTLAEKIGEGKLQVGLSAYGLRVSARQLTAGGLELKKALRASGKSVRLVQNQEIALNSAQVLHNHLTGERGIEVVLVQSGGTTIIARTAAEQDIEAYAARDQGRPKRDAFVGMLPPKLAQTIVNLAVAQTPPSSEFVVLDPFCGTGVVLQETLLMGYGIYGTDLEPRMIDYTEANLDWLEKVIATSPRTAAPSKWGGRPWGTPAETAKSESRKGEHGLTGPQSALAARKEAKYELEAGDATTHQWQGLINAVACETYLGQPFSAIPSAEKLAKVRETCNLIVEKFLKNVGAQLQSGARLCLAVPAWQAKPGQFIHLPLLDHLGDLGYNRIDFKYVRGSELLYYRPDQVVARELLVITRK